MGVSTVFSSLAQVVPGWEMALVGAQGIPPAQAGAVRTVVIPPGLAYGDRGEGRLFGRAQNRRVPPGQSVAITFAYKGLAFWCFPVCGDPSARV